MRLDELAGGLGLTTEQASDHLWQLGIIADASTDLSGAMLSAARDHLVALAAFKRPAPEPLDSREKSSDAPEAVVDTADVEPTASTGRSRINVEPPTGAHRVYELSQQTGVPTEALIAAAQRVGLKADHVSQLSESEIQALWIALADDPPDGLIEKRVGKSIKRRRRIRNG